MKKTLLLDNYDSFTYNLLHTLKEVGCTDIDVRYNDSISLDEVDGYDRILLSPGPGLPEEAGILLPLIRRYASSKRILGVCLGHQAIAQAFGGKLINLSHVYHGVSSPIHSLYDELLFHAIPQPFEVGRYHSWAVSPDEFPSCLEITAQSPDQCIMALRHREYDVRGIQFHPESVLTPFGKQMISNLING